jgi:DMSO/TMAO reductase YedYZ molybdopterin-dependent catalytic subunit
MSRGRLLSRRNVLLAGAAAAGGLFLPRWASRNLPPTYGNLLRMGDNLTYASHRLLLPGQAMVREYGPRDITSIPVIFVDDRYKTDPEHPVQDEAYRQAHAAGFPKYSLRVEGLVVRPRSYSLADLRRFPARTQITRHTCEEGWAAIAGWTGVQLGWVLEEGVGLLPDARYVTFHCVDKYVDSIDLLDALHPQTLLAYEMNGRALSVPHGAPVRLRVETQLGYKSMKYVRKIVVTSELDDGGKAGNIQNGWAWYAGI